MAIALYDDKKYTKTSKRTVKKQMEHPVNSNFQEEKGHPQLWKWHFKHETGFPQLRKWLFKNEMGFPQLREGYFKQFSSHRKIRKGINYILNEK